MFKSIKKAIKAYRDKKLFLRIYFLYLEYGNNPENAINDAFEDFKALKNVLHDKLEN